MHSTLGLVSHLCFAGLGVMLVYHGLRKSTQYQSLWMRWRNQPAVPISTGQRAVLVAIGSVLTVISLSLALGIAH